MAHTSGPWDQIGTEEISKTFVVWRSNYNDATDTRIIARGIDSEDDARLVAAAPDLLEALIRMLPDSEHFHLKDKARIDCVPLSMARAAIAKATQTEI